MKVKINAKWKEFLKQEFEKEYFIRLVDFIREEYQLREVYPKGSEIFRAFDLCPPDKLKVVIMGQDPYHGKGQANGLCFSVDVGVKLPPSLSNIFKELKNDVGVEKKTGDLGSWAKQGILLLNSTLTVESHKPLSHKNKGWEIFTSSVISKISEHREHLVFILWGSQAQQKEVLMKGEKHLILKSSHPSPFSVQRGFYGSKPFSKTNVYLQKHGFNPIKW